MTIEQARTRAIEITLKRPINLFIIELDSGDDRAFKVVSEDYLDSDDFIAFDGRVLAEYFDGVEC